MKNEILVHVCCAPCAVFVLEHLVQQDFNIRCFWFNPNIHPFLEYSKRLKTVQKLCDQMSIPLVCNSNYEPQLFLQQTVNCANAFERCCKCYDIRAEKTAQLASDLGISLCTTTLLYSKYQNHTQISQSFEKFAHDKNINFFYEDFRRGWTHGIEASRNMGLYRQQYCGCLFSEHERFANCVDKYLASHSWHYENVAADTISKNHTT